MISFLTELWHLLDVSAVVGHDVVLAVLLFQDVFFFSFIYTRFWPFLCFTSVLDPLDK